MTDPLRPTEEDKARSIGCERRQSSDCVTEGLGLARQRVRN